MSSFEAELQHLNALKERALLGGGQDRVDAQHERGKLAARATSAGWHVRIMQCPDGADWNDVSSGATA